MKNRHHPNRPGTAKQGKSRHSKRGFELSIGFFVILILTIIIFAGSLFFLRQFYTSTEEFRDEIDRDTESQIQALIRDGSIVAIPINKATLPPGKGASFWVGIQNVLDEEKQFGMTVAFSKAFTPLEEQILEADPSYIGPHWALYSEGPHAIKNNDFTNIPIRVVVGSEIAQGVPVKKGTYAFN
ncbi:hypothetical protein HY492_02580, partial [Candidatus Woesearchaeota archaeon]|nr:hypothetical protein [Candidatus Woesearchaeota archaeon]